MDKKEYRRAVDEIRIKALNDMTQLAVDYCMEHNTVKIGDFVTDHKGTIKVEEIRVSECELCCVYYGPGYTQKLQPKKNTETMQARQCNIKK